MAEKRAKRTMSTDRRRIVAAELIAGGEIIKDVAAIVGVSEGTVFRWMRDPECIEAYRKMLSVKGYDRYARAMKVLDKQMDGDNAWVAQGAAREVANRYHDAVTGEASREVIIKVEGMPDLGMPDAATDDTD